MLVVSLFLSLDTLKPENCHNFTSKHGSTLIRIEYENFDRKRQIEYIFSKISTKKRKNISLKSQSCPGQRYTFFVWETYT